MKMMKEIFFSTTFGGETIIHSFNYHRKVKRLNIERKKYKPGKLLSERLNKIINASKLKNYIEISKVYWPELF